MREAMSLKGLLVRLQMIYHYQQSSSVFLKDLKNNVVALPLAKAAMLL